MHSIALLSLLLCLPARNEKALRESFQKEMKAAEPAKRAEAAKKLAGAKEEETIALLAGHLKDAAKEVQLAVAETLAGLEDGAGVALKPLAAALVDRKVDPDVRMACAKVLVKSKYKVEPIGAMVETICNISNEDRHLHKFGGEVTGMLNAFTGEDFGKGKQTPGLWEQWWADNKEKLKKADEALLAEYRKSQKK